MIRVACFGRTGLDYHTARRATLRRKIRIICAALHAPGARLVAQYGGLSVMVPSVNWRGEPCEFGRVAIGFGRG